MGAEIRIGGGPRAHPKVYRSTPLFKNHQHVKAFELSSLILFKTHQRISLLAFCFEANCINPSLATLAPPLPVYASMPILRRTEPKAAVRASLASAPVTAPGGRPDIPPPDTGCPTHRGPPWPDVSISTVRCLLGKPALLVGLGLRCVPPSRRHR